MVDEKFISEFNEMAFQIQRLNNIWLNCESLSKRGNFMGWNWELDNARKELNWDARDLDYKYKRGYIKNLNEIDNAITIAIILNKQKILYKLLTKKEMILREIQQECGKGTKYKSTDEDDMD